VKRQLAYLNSSPFRHSDVVDVPNNDLHLPLLNIEDADEELSLTGSRWSRRASRQTNPDSSLLVDGKATPTENVVQSTENIAEIAARALEQLEPEITDVQLVEVINGIGTTTRAVFDIRRQPCSIRTFILCEYDSLLMMSSIGLCN